MTHVTMLVDSPILAWTGTEAAHKCSANRVDAHSVLLQWRYEASGLTPSAVTSAENAALTASHSVFESHPPLQLHPPSMPAAISHHLVT